MKKYELRNGKYGMYFYDIEKEESIPLNDVLSILNDKRIDKIEFMARIRHLGWICYQIACEQDYNEEPTKDQLDSLKQGVKYALEHPNMTSEENHENWMKMKVSQGWKYGSKKDFIKKEHPDLIPYDELPDIEKRKDKMDRIMNDLANKLWDMI